jgi:putative hemolysin
MTGVHPAILVLVLVLLLGFSAFFSGSETALMAISRLRLRHLEERNPKRAKLVEHILRQPERLIGTILLGNNLVNVALTAIATAVAISLWGERGIVYVTAALTAVILIFAEITPKVYAKYYNERVSFWTAPILSVIMLIFRPIEVAVTYISSRLLRVMGIDVSKKKVAWMMTEKVLHTAIKMGREEGAITEEERRMVSRVFTLNDLTVGEIMVPREKMTVLPLDAPLDKIVKTVLKTGFTRFPVVSGEGEILGTIVAKDLFTLIDKKKPDLKKILRPPLLVPADRKIDAQLRSFKARRIHQAVVLDAGGEVAGLVTLEDILEELVGSIMDEHDIPEGG